MEKVRSIKKTSLYIYCFMFIYLIFQINYYERNVGNFPDECYHISYIAYLENQNRIIPNFAEMDYIVEFDGEIEESYKYKYEGLNYLGHPPLYYNILSFVNKFEFKNGLVEFDLNSLRQTSQIILYIGVIIVFVYGYKNIKQNSLHLLFATIIISVPMFTYTAGGINNDILSFLGVSIFVISLINVLEIRKSFLWYWMLAIGVFIVAMNKLTTLVLISIAGIIVLLYTCITEKSMKIIINKYFLSTILAYVLIAGYYVYNYVEYGAFQPSLQVLDYEYLMETDFYVDVEERVNLEASEYINIALTEFFESWTGIFSHIRLMKNESMFYLMRYPLMLICIIPLFNIRNYNNNTNLVCSSVYIGCVITFFTQIYQSYMEYLDRGFFGGYQSRYYLCAIFPIALTIIMYFQDRFEYFRGKIKYSEKLFSGICIVFSTLLICSDFIYFLVYY